jgi:hypothetical protein
MLKITKLYNTKYENLIFFFIYKMTQFSEDTY